MLSLKEVVSVYDIDKSNNLISIDELNSIEDSLNMEFSSMLKEYILRYGYIGYNSIEFYGVNSLQKEKSDMIVQTRYLHETFIKTKGYVAFNKNKEHEYVLISDDMIYYYDSLSDEITKTNMNLFEYIKVQLENENK